MDNQPLITVVLPCRNSEKYLEDALKSLENQNFKDFEVLLIDGRSADDTRSIASRYAFVNWINQESKGLTEAWNEGIAKAKGTYICFLDSDDYWDENCLKNHVETLRSKPECLASIGMVKFFLENPDNPSPGFKRSLLQEPHHAYMPGCFMGHKSIFEKLGLFPLHLGIASDIAWFGDLKNSSLPVLLLDKIVLNKRVHEENLSYTTAQTPVYQKDLLKYLRESIANRR